MHIAGMHELHKTQQNQIVLSITWIFSCGLISIEIPPSIKKRTTITNPHMLPRLLAHLDAL